MNSNVTAHLSKRLVYKKGDYIFKKGDPRDDAYIIVEGSVAIITTSLSGAEEVGSMLSAGDIFGEMALMEQGERTAAARAVADTEVYAISREVIKERMAGMDPVISTLFALLVDRYRKTRIYIPESAELPDPERVVQHLKEMAGKDRGEGAPMPDESNDPLPEILEGLRPNGQDAIEELGMEQKISDGLKYGEFVPWLQPILDLASEEIVGFEALARWEKKDGTIIMPYEFIPAAERLNMVQHIDYSIFDHMCATIRRCMDESAFGNGPFISVNLSGVHFTDETVVGVLKETLEEHKIPPKHIKFEITESALMTDSKNAQIILSKLKDLGVGIALDDFGTGYSSLNYLHKFPIDTIKIDRSFVSQITNEKRSMDIIKAIVAMADSFKIDVVAEGIEKKVEMQLLESVGCQMGQGYYFGRPAPQKEALKLLRDR